MSSPKILHNEKAIRQWNKAVFSSNSIAPYSFNPSLFYFFQRHFRWKPYYFILWQDNKIAGLFPLINTGKAIVSLPHFSYGGIWQVLSVTNKSEIIDNLIAFIRQNGTDPGFYNVETEDFNYATNFSGSFFIRSLDNPQDNKFKKSEKVTYLMELYDEQQTFASLSSNLRRKIRKASKAGFEFKTGGLELLEDFYSVYIPNIRLLKSLNYGKIFFKDLLTTWDFGNIMFFVAYKNSIPVASSLLASYGAFYENIYFATLPAFRRFYLADWLHWQMIKKVMNEAEKDSISKPIYSYGRSTEFSSVHKYKMHWPVKVVPLYVYSNINDFKKTSLLTGIWKILPEIITKPLSPKLIKHIY